MKKFLCTMVAFLLAFSLCACDSLENVLEQLNQPKPKTFQIEDQLSIQLNDDFFRMDMIARDFDFCLGSDEIVIFGTRVDLAEQELWDVSAWEYAQALRDTMNESTLTAVEDCNGTPVMQYETYNEDGELQTVFISIYEGSDCFWLLQFIFDTEDYNELYPLAVQYAKSVVCS